MKTSIDYTKAISSGILTFEEACAIQGATMTEAIQEGILTFQQACALQGMSIENACAPMEKTAPKRKKSAKKQAKTKAEEPKAEEPKAEEFSYTSGGAIIQYAGHHTLKPNNLRRVNNAMEKLVDAGFCVSWKRIGSWLYIYHDRKADKKTAAEYRAVKLAAGWVNIKGAWVDNTMLADYVDSFKK